MAKSDIPDQTAHCVTSDLGLHSVRCIFLGPVVQSIVSLMSLLVVKLLTVLISTISNSQVFLLEKKKKKNSVYAIFNARIFNDTLTNDIVSFEQLGPDCLG